MPEDIWLCSGTLVPGTTRASMQLCSGRHVAVGIQQGKFLISVDIQIVYIPFNSNDKLKVFTYILIIFFFFLCRWHCRVRNFSCLWTMVGEGDIKKSKLTNVHLLGVQKEQTEDITLFCLSTEAGTL